MSGGAFDYAYERVNTFCDELDKYRLWHVNNYEFNTLTAMLSLSNMCREVAKQMKSLEWMASGDTSEEDFVREYRKFQST